MDNEEIDKLIQETNINNDLEESDILNSPQQSNEEIKIYLTSRRQDLPNIIKDFAERQKELLLKERVEEEKMNIENISNWKAKDLEQMGICMRKLEVVETSFESYGKYLIQFKRRTDTNKIDYKFGCGDIVGIFTYQDYLDPKPITTGMVKKVSRDNTIEAIFDSEFNYEMYSKNIALVMLCNYATYDKIEFTLKKLEDFNIKQHSLDLINVLFGTSNPTMNMNSSEKSLIFKNPSLNLSQKEAIQFAIDSNELALIHGPPGTGKTTTIVEFIIQSVIRGEKVLVCAPSNLAVDNIAEKLLPFTSMNNINICRIGHPGKLLSSIQNISLDNKIENSIEMKSGTELNKQILSKRKELVRLGNKMKAKKEYNRENKDKIKQLSIEIKQMTKQVRSNYKQAALSIINNSDIILSTLVGSGDKNLYNTITNWTKPYFDCLVIDECAQAIESACWIPILLSKKLVLAGDHLQLPPTIKNKSIMKELGYTLFDRMTNLYEEKCNKLLSIQYRMNSKIMGFSNKELYKDKLEADSSVRDHLLKDIINDKNIIDKDEHEILDKPLLYIDTTNYDFEESYEEENSSKYNIGEVRVCLYLVNYLLKVIGVSGKAVGIITPYSSQVNHLKEEISKISNDIEVSTVDGFQGREKEIIIISLVRSNFNKDIGFLSESRRLNVALTRGKRLLCLVGNFSMLVKYKNSCFLENMREYFFNNAYSIEIMNSILGYNELEEIRLLNKSNNKASISKKEQNIVSCEKQKKKKVKNKEKENEKKIEKDNQVVNNKNYPKDEDSHFEECLYSKNENEKDKKTKIFNDMLDKFLCSPLNEYKLTGLNPFERRIIHEICENKNLNHISKGEGNERFIYITKRNNEENNNRDIILENKVNHEELIQNKEKGQESIVKMQKIGKKEAKSKESQQKEDDDYLDSIISNIKLECTFGICKSLYEVKICEGCNLNYCKDHFIKYKHGCEYHQKDNSSWNSKDKGLFKNKISDKLNKFNEARTKKENKKK